MYAVIFILFYSILFYGMELKRRNFEESLCIFHMFIVTHVLYCKSSKVKNSPFVFNGIKIVGQGKAVLLGPDVEQRNWSCFRMIYQVTGSASLQVQKHTDGESFDEVLWMTQSPSDRQLIASIDLQNSTETFKVRTINRIKISDKYCIECDFEEDHLCGYTNEWNRYMNWRVGRSDDTALNDGTGQYMYVDSKSFQEVARLASPMTTVPMSGCLSFQYQQYHAGDHLFTLFSRDQAGHQELWRADLPENNNVNWCPETRFGPPMPGNQKYCLKFFYSLRGLSGTDQVLSAYLYYNDGSKQVQIWTQNYKIRNVWIAVELTIQSQKNAQVRCCSSVGLDINVTLGDSSSVSVLSHCDFEAGLCGFTQDKEGDSGDWMLARGPTPTSYTGPRGDHTTGFYYHMYGSGIGQLSVYLQTGQGNQDKLLWTSHGEQGISWLRASVNYQCDQQHQIVFEATRGASVRSDIAIDDIVFERGPCRGILNNLMITYICYSRYHKHLYEIEYLCPLFKHVDVDFLSILLSCDWIV
uniref:MAM domain-containing protein n=1 Tax=Sinocyclocheilus rhinocerous TaxID=307959 RepID=A0A673GGV7_9TELE